MKIGIHELLVVFIVALIVVGPDKLPYYAKKLGQGMAMFRKYASEATKDIRENIVEPLEEAQRPLKEALEPVAELNKEVQGSVNDIKQSFSDIGKNTEIRPEQKKAEQEIPSSMEELNAQEIGTEVLT